MIGEETLMNDKKIAVIAQCETNGVSAIRPYLDAIDVPQGYAVELIEVALRRECCRYLSARDGAKRREV